MLPFLWPDAVALKGGPDCVVFGQKYNFQGIISGQSAYIAVRPEDVEIQLAAGPQVPSGVIRGTVQTALFVGEKIEYHVEVEGQGLVLICGERHDPVNEGDNVWLKLRPDGHTAWVSNMSRSDDLDLNQQSNL
jgi:ABC-type Fe3+/spermidine/putrescine transport system ATPase subunit